MSSKSICAPKEEKLEIACNLVEIEKVRHSLHINLDNLQRQCLDDEEKLDLDFALSLCENASTSIYFNSNLACNTMIRLSASMIVFAHKTLRIARSACKLVPEASTHSAEFNARHLATEGAIEVRHTL